LALIDVDIAIAFIRSFVRPSFVDVVGKVVNVCGDVTPNALLQNIFGILTYLREGPECAVRQFPAVDFSAF
jgi:hypothetical protein